MRWISVPLVLLTAYLVAKYMAFHTISYREVIAGLVALSAIIVVMAGARGVQLGLIIWVFTLGIGYRTFAVTPHLRIHPAELILWGLMILVLIQRNRADSSAVSLRPPLWFLFFIPFCVWGWILGASTGNSWDSMLEELKNFFLLVPLFIVASSVLYDREQWRPMILAFYAVGTWIAAMGVLEYVFPTIRDVLPGFVSDPTPHLTREGFARASFSFWGTPAATFICVLTVPMAAVVWKWYRLPWQRSLTVLALLIQVFGIYIGGYRTAWLLLGVMFGVWMVFRFGTLVGTLSFLPTLAVYRLFPEPAQERWVTLMAAIQGNPIDHSAMTRWERAKEGLAAIATQPWGYGWGAAGWMHNDFIQVGANLGLAAGILFCGAYAVTLVRSWRVAKSCDAKDPRKVVSISILISFAATGGILGTTGVQVLPQLLLPVWFVWVLAVIWHHDAENREIE